MVEERTFALKLEYDGTAYGGSQFQSNAKTVQEELEKALEPLAGRPQRAAFAGRTDAGVHATGQVATVAVPTRWTAADLQRALNARLPGDISVVAAMTVNVRFDPRRCATSRRYEYRILNAVVRSPLARRTVWYMPHHLNMEAMQRSMAQMVGEHDFAAFAGRVDEGSSTVRTMTRADLKRVGSLITLEFEANAFLPHQVRRMVGALVETGRERLSERAFTEFLLKAKPGAAGPTAPPQGLSLVEVAYESVRFEMGENG